MPETQQFNRRSWAIGPGPPWVCITRVYASLLYTPGYIPPCICLPTVHPWVHHGIYHPEVHPGTLHSGVTGWYLREALGSVRRFSLGRVPFPLFGAEKCDDSYGRRAPCARARAHGLSDDRIAQGGFKALGALKQHPARRSLPGRARLARARAREDSHSGYPLSGVKRRPRTLLLLLLPKGPGP